MLVYLKQLKTKVGKVKVGDYVYGRVVINLPREFIGDTVYVLVYADVLKTDVFKKQ